MIIDSRLLLKCSTFRSRLHDMFIQADWIKCLISRMFKINDTWNSFHEVLKKKSYDFIQIDKFVQKDLQKAYVTPTNDKAKPKDYDTQDNIQKMFKKVTKINRQIRKSAKVIVVHVSLKICNCFSI